MGGDVAVDAAADLVALGIDLDGLDDFDRAVDAQGGVAGEGEDLLERGCRSGEREHEGDRRNGPRRRPSAAGIQEVRRRTPKGMRCSRE